MATVNKELSATRAKCAALHRNPRKVFLKLRALETDLGESLVVMSERTTEGSSMMLKKIFTDVAQEF